MTPIGAYLAEMGKIPMLTAQEELHVAQQICYWRRRYRTSLLASDFVLQGVVDELIKAELGQVRFDRIVDVAVTDMGEKHRLMSRLGPNLNTLRQLLRLNKRDYMIAIARSHPPLERRGAWRRLIRRRYRAVRLVEELRLRTEVLNRWFEQLNQISLRMQSLQQRLQAPSGAPGDEMSREAWRSELHALMRTSLDSPATITWRQQRTEQYRWRYHAAIRRLTAGNLRLVVSIAKKYRVVGLSTSGSYSGGQYRTHARGR